MKNILITTASISFLILSTSRSTQACFGFCDNYVDFACDQLLKAKDSREAATLAVKVVRAYDKLAARNADFRKKNLSVDYSKDLFSWCMWATGR